MTKKQFLSTLRNKLQILNDQEIEDIIEEYENHINCKMKDGKTEKEAIKDFGNIDELVKEILSAYKISDHYSTTQSKFDYYINFIVDKMVYFFKDLGHLLSTQKGENIIRIVFKVLLMLLFIWLLKLPFYLIEGFGRMILKVLPFHFYRVFGNVWQVLVWFAYLVVALITLYSFLKRLLEEDKNEQQEKVSIKKNIDEKKKTEQVKKNREKPNYAKMMFQPFLVVIKVLVILVTLPGWIFIIGLATTLGILISLLFQGIYLISAFFIVIGLLLVASSLLGIIYYFTFRKGVKSE